MINGSKRKDLEEERNIKDLIIKVNILSFIIKM